ncbi:MAG: metal-dependent transcriptional regulator [Gemmatimonadales bacterium]
MTAEVGREVLTRSVEDYLKAIYRLSADGHPASTSQIAQLLELSAPSVSGMVRRLSEQGLLEHVPYRGVLLTAEGRRIALRMIRRHRLLEAYLVAFLGYTWDTVHEEAERLEHAVSDPLVERMAHALGHPRVDPHGDPIPAPDGSMEEAPHLPLTEVPVGESVVICRADTTDDGLLRYIASSALMPGTRVTVVEHQPFHGPLRLRADSGERVIGHELAGILLCAREEQ